jgi:fluoride ion exporter CrcB/FEX
VGARGIGADESRPRRLPRTTFSTYTLDIHQLLEADRPGLALTYMALTAISALAAVWVGATTVRLLASQ